AQVGRVDRQVRDFPQFVGFLLSQAFLDGVLVRAGEGGKDQVASVRVTGVHGQLVAVLGGATHFVDVREVQFRVHALGVQVQGQGHQANVAGALAATEQAAFDTVCASHHSQFSSRYRRATVVV